MKALRTLLTAVVLLAGSVTMNAQRMSVAAMQNNARFLTDRMAYTLGIRDPFLIDEIYRINYDYIWGVNDYLDDVALGYYYDDYMTVCAARDAALRSLLGYTVWNRLLGYSYFHRPIVFANRGWRFSIYDYDRFGPRRFHYAPPRPIARGYAGGHFFSGMPPRGGRPAGPAPGMAPHGGNPHGGTPQMGTPHGNTPHGGNPQTRPSGRSGGRTSALGTGTRSDNNLRSSSRMGDNTPRTSGAASRGNAGMTRGAGASPSRGASSPSRGGGAGGGRR